MFSPAGRRDCRAHSSFASFFLRRLYLFSRQSKVVPSSWLGWILGPRVLVCSFYTAPPLLFSLFPKFGFPSCSCELRTSDINEALAAQFWFLFFYFCSFSVFLGLFSILFFARSSAKRFAVSIRFHVRSPFPLFFPPPPHRSSSPPPV